MMFPPFSNKVEISYCYIVTMLQCYICYTRQKVNKLRIKNKQLSKVANVFLHYYNVMLYYFIFSLFFIRDKYPYSLFLTY